MELLKRLCILIFFSFIILSCNEDNDTRGPEPIETVSLTFTTETEEDQITGFANNAMIEYDGKVWIIGGYNDYHPPLYSSNSDVWASNNGKNWFSVSSENFPARSGHSISVINDKLWIIGGLDDRLAGFSDIWSSSDGMTWILEDNDPVFGEVYHHTVTRFGSKHYLINGSSVWSSSNGINWNLETNRAFPNRNYHKTIVFNDELYVIGGLDTSGNRMNEIWKSPDGINWTEITPTGDVFSARINHTATVYNGKTWVIAGRNGTTIYKDIYYSSDMINWTAYDVSSDSDDSTDGLYAHNILLYNDALWIFGGYKISNASSKITSIKED